MVSLLSFVNVLLQKFTIERRYYSVVGIIMFKLIN